MKSFTKTIMVAASMFAFYAYAAEQKSLSDFALEQGTDVLIKNQVEGKSLKDIAKEKSKQQNKARKKRLNRSKANMGLIARLQAQTQKCQPKQRLNKESKTKSTRALRQPNKKSAQKCLKAPTKKPAVLLV